MAPQSPEELQFNQRLATAQGQVNIDPELEASNLRMDSAFRAGASQEELLRISKEEGQSAIPEFDEEAALETINFLDSNISALYEKTKGTDNIRNLAVPQATILGELDVDKESLMLLRGDPSIRSTLDEMFLKDIDQAKQDVENAFQESLSIDPFDVENTILASQDIDKEIEESAAEIGAKEERFAQAIAPLNFKEERKKLVKLQTMMANDIADMYDAVDWIDLTQDFAATALIPLNINVTEETILSDERLNVLFDNPEETMSGMLREWHTIDIERRMEYWPLLKEVIIDSARSIGVLGKLGDPNIFKAKSFLELFMDPVKGPATAELQSQLDIAFGVLDSGIVSLSLKMMANTGRAVIKSSHIAKQADEIQNPELSSDIMTNNVVDEDFSTISGITHQESVNIVDPLVTVEKFSPEDIKDLSPEVINKLNNVARIKSNTLTTFTEDGNRLRYSLTSTPEREAAILKETQRLEERIAEDYLTEEGFYLRNVEVDKLTDTGTTIRYEIVDRTTGEDIVTSVGESKVTWQINAVTGDFEETVTALRESPSLLEGSRLLLSPSFIARQAKEGKTIPTDFFDTFRAASNLDDIQELDKKLIRNVLDLTMEPYKKLNKNSRKNVDDVLISGDEYINQEAATKGREWTVRELRSGIIKRPGGGTVKLTTDGEISAYLENRMFNDMMFQLQNQATRRQYEVMGIKNVLGLERIGGLARIYDTPLAAGASDVTGSSITILDRRTGDLESYSKEFMEQAYEEGHQLVRLNSPALLPDDLKTIKNTNQFYNFALVHSDDIKELPAIVNHRRPGYVPKKNKGVEFLVKENTTSGSLNGKSFGNPKTLRFLSNEKDAQKVVDDLVDNETRAIESDPDLTDSQKTRQLSRLGDKYSVVRDRELTTAQLLGEGAGWSGGPFNKARASEQIMYGLNGIQTERFSPLEVYQREINHIVPYLSRNEWRLGEQQRWVNTVSRSMGDNAEVRGFNTVLPTNHPDTPALEQLRNQIRTWTSVPTQQETLWSGALQGIHDWSLWGVRGVGFKNKESIKSVLYFKHKDPFSALKSASFHASLGLLNPVQLYVQGQAATMAAARFPKEAPRSLAYAFKMAYLDMVEDPSAFGRVSSIMSDVETPLIKEVHSAWQRTGFKNSVRTNADINSMELGLGNSMNAFKRAIDSGLVFYRAGELFNRRFSFNSSYLNWKRLNPGKIPNDNQLKAIMGEAKVSMLELNRANAARFQGGPDATFMESVLGVMFQFGQVATKTMELAARGSQRGGFTGPQKARIVAANLALFGTVGVPLANKGLDYFLELTGTPKETLDPKLVSQWEGGLMEVALRHAFGADVDIGSRAAIASNMATFFADLVDGSEGVSWRTAGALGSLGTRTGDLISLGIYPVLDSTLADDKELTMEDMMAIGKQLANVPTSSRNIMAAWIMATEDKIFDSKGNIIAQSDFNLATELMTGFGFAPSVRTRVFELQADNFDVQAQIKAATDIYFSLITNSALINDGSAPSKDGLRKADRYLMRKIPEALHQQIRDNIREKFLNPTTVEERELQKWYKNRVIDPVTGILTDPMDRSFFRDFSSKKPLQQPLGPQVDLSKQEEE